jgi:hypothetical protein
MIRHLLLVSIFTIALSGCGYVHMRPYGYVEVYQLVPDKFHLRIPYLQTSRGNSHGLLLVDAKKNKDYIAGIWFVVDAIDGKVALTNFNSESSCPYGNLEYPRRLVRGSFLFENHMVTVRLQRYNGPVVTDEEGWFDHEFNGRYEIRKLNTLKESEHLASTHIPNDICPDKPKSSQ